MTHLVQWHKAFCENCWNFSMWSSSFKNIFDNWSTPARQPFTDRGRVTHICIRKLGYIYSVNFLSPFFGPSYDLNRWLIFLIAQLKRIYIMIWIEMNNMHTKEYIGKCPGQNWGNSFGSHCLNPAQSINAVITLGRTDTSIVINTISYIYIYIYLGEQTFILCVMCFDAAALLFACFLSQLRSKCSHR